MLAPLDSPTATTLPGSRPYAVAASATKSASWSVRANRSGMSSWPTARRRKNRGIPFSSTCPRGDSRAAVGASCRPSPTRSCSSPRCRAAAAGSSPSCRARTHGRSRGPGWRDSSVGSGRAGAGGGLRTPHGRIGQWRQPRLDLSPLGLQERRQTSFSPSASGVSSASKPAPSSVASSYRIPLGSRK